MPVKFAVGDRVLRPLSDLDLTHPPKRQIEDTVIGVRNEHIQLASSGENRWWHISWLEPVDDSRSGSKRSGMPIDYKRVVAIRGWARGRAGIRRVHGGYCTILFDGEDGYLHYYHLEDIVESEDEFEDFVHLVRTESRQTTEP